MVLMEISGTYKLFRAFFDVSFKVIVTGLQQPRQKNMLSGGESANGGTGILSISTQRSNPLASATHCLADTAKECRNSK